MDRQRTLIESIHCTGIGLHSGEEVHLSLRPAAAGTGVVFVRTDLARPVEIPAKSKFVVDTALATTLGKGNVRIGTVEHLLATLFALGIDNCRVEIDGPEIPVLDGSATQLVDLVRAGGVRVQTAPRRTLVVRRPITVREGDKQATLLPASRFSIDYTIDFRHPLASEQSLALDIDAATFCREIAPARTFCFKRDIERMQAVGLARGGSLDNAVVVDDFHVLNPGGLRFTDEFVRHKILDVIGDLALLGMPVVGRLIAVKSGHALNQALVRAIATEAAASEIVEARPFSGTWNAEPMLVTA